jgi:hypothetical protein
MTERVRIIAEQALALSASEREQLYRALAASLGKSGAEAFEISDSGQLSDEAKAYLAAAWDKGIASVPGRYATIEDVIAEARRRLSPSEEEAVREGREQVRRGEFVSDEEVEAFYQRHGL